MRSAGLWSGPGQGAAGDLIGARELARHVARKRGACAQSRCTRPVVRLDPVGFGDEHRMRLAHRAGEEHREPAELLQVCPDGRLGGQVKHALQQGRGALPFACEPQSAPGAHRASDAVFVARAEKRRGLEGAGGGRVGAAREGARRRRLEQRGDLFVRPGVCRRQMPGRSFTGAGADRRREGAVRGAPPGRVAEMVGGGADERVPELDPLAAQDDHPVPLGGLKRVRAQPCPGERPRDLPGRPRVARSGDEERVLRIPGKDIELLREGPLEAGAYRERTGDRRLAQQFGVGQGRDCFEDRQRVAPRLGDDPVPHRRIDRRSRALDQRRRVRGGQPVQLQGAESRR